MDQRFAARGQFSLTRILASIALSVAFLVQAGAPALALGGVIGSISGKVLEPGTGTPVSGASVSAVSPISTLSTTTDANGFYSFVGVPVDTYTISFQKKGYQPVSFPGVTVQGDQSVSVDATLQRSLITIGRVTVRSAASAYQPKQSLDSYQISGSGLQTALGKSFAISQSQLQQSVPSITNTIYGSSSIRGSTRTELAYQFEGIDYTDPLSNQFQNSLGLNGVQALQVNPGAGDASQGNAGAGAINLVVKRGSRPAFGTLDLETSLYPFVHQAALDYGFATPNGRFSNYSSFLAQDQYRTYGARGKAAVDQNTFFSAEYVISRDFVNNMIYKFGRDNKQQLQFVYQTRFSDFQFNHGGFSQLCYKTCDPNFGGIPNAGPGGNGINGQLTGGTYFASGTPNQRIADFRSIIGLLPGQTSPVQNLYYPGYNHQPVDLFKLEHDVTLNNGAYIATRLYRVVGNARFDRPYDSQSTTSRVNQAQGGARTGINGDLFKQFGDKNLVSLSYVYEGNKSVYDYVADTPAYRSLTPILNATPKNPGGQGYEIADFIGSGLFCPDTDPNGAPIIKSAAAPARCGYLAQFFGGTTPRIPNFNNISPGFQQTYGVGLRDQISVSNKLKLDLGLRLDGANYQILEEQNVAQKFTDDNKKPKVWQPRGAFAYQIGNDDGIRFSYGRSVQFTPAGIANTPVAYSVPFKNIPSYDNRTGMPATFCGKNNDQVCTSYAQQLHDEYVAFFNGPEAFAVVPATFNNFDFSYQHQFRGNVGMKVTPFYKRGYNVNVFSQAAVGTDPVTGLPIFGPPILTNAGNDRTTGVEFYMTKQAAYGFSGFLALTYVNRLQNIPPGYLGQTEDFYPSAPPQSLALNNLYRAGYLSPLSGRLGLTYKTHGGLRVNPIFTYDKGYPIGAGLLTSGFINGVAKTIPNTNASIPGVGAVGTAGGAFGVSQYVDPLNPGSLYRPNIAATRGTPEGNNAGGILSKARVNTDVSVEFSVPNSRSTIGVYVSNLFNNIYNEPSFNTRWQPVATGVGGPQTGQTSGTVTFGPALGFANYGADRQGYKPYLFNDNNAPIQFRFYYQLGL